MRTLTSAAIAAINEWVSDGVFLWLIDISHQAFGTLRFVNNTKDIVSNGETYTAFDFRLNLIDEVKGELTDALLDVSNIDRQAITLLSQVDSDNPVQVSARVILASAPDDTVLGPINWIIKEATGGEMRMECTLGLRSLRNRRFPAHQMAPEPLPALFPTFT